MATKKIPSLAELRLCVDRVVPQDHKVTAAALAVEENKENQPIVHVPAGASFHPMKMAILTGKKWENGRKLTVSFLDGSATQKQKTQKHAESWMQYANIALEFGNKADADVRISFVADSGSWSGVGTDNLLREAFPLDQPTMNFGWLRDTSADDEWRRVVVHEFGHALGAIHEHQNPKGGIKWNVPAVLQTFGGPPNNWSEADIRFNILDKYSIDQLNATKFDIKSIMLYGFPASLILGGAPGGTPNNTKMSSADKKFIAQMYPKGAAAKKQAKAAKPRTHTK
jgi:hypothetical protein